ncbi:unnamed protein product [Wuchereria bancrofti]|uniref:Coatomer subunit epsilon n=1 Tax=Wuchereria bancrofti TaxID=6293 RepID=A0A3P7FX16_WUCBA|nr:unnamed protein product [Wuchereria bancrofti]
MCNIEIFESINNRDPQICIVVYYGRGRMQRVISSLLRLLLSTLSDFRTYQTMMTKANDDVDHLFEVRNNFYLGAYQNCINEAQNLRVKEENDKLLKDVYMYRAYLAQNKPNLVLSEIEKSSTSPALRAVRRFADYLANPDKRATIMKEFETELNEEIPHDETVLLLAAHMYIRERVCIFLMFPCLHL